MFSCARSRLRIVSRETGSATPPRISLFIVSTQAESGAYFRGSSRFSRRRLIVLGPVPSLPGHANAYR